MPLTNAQKQAAHRQRKAAKIARYEAALREIAQRSEPQDDVPNTEYNTGADAAWEIAGNIARQALGDAA